MCTVGHNMSAVAALQHSRSTIGRSALGLYGVLGELLQQLSTWVEFWFGCAATCLATAASFALECAVAYDSVWLAGSGLYWLGVAAAGSYA